MRLLARLEGLPRATAFALSVALALALGALHRVIDPMLSFQLFYLLPVSLAAWTAGRAAGLVVAGIAAIAWLVGDLATPAIASHGGVVAWNALLRGCALGVVGWMITALRRALEHERAVSRTDFVTGLPNWRAFAERAGYELDRAQRYERPLTLAYVDLDDFKVVNDRFGHATGDQLLGTVADTMHDVLRRTDVIARLGGDEFAVLLPETGAEPAWIVLRKLHNAIRLAMEAHGWPVTASVGAVTCEVPPAHVDALIRHADQLMYEVKREGKDRIRQVVIEAPPDRRHPAEARRAGGGTEGA
ncbi:MAG TPA: GGDEF domain-containing protein [Gemmatimonadales bacterium]|nr:GGDEF domain-containing protein [Gemmatimonadales bacterium]